VISSRPIDERRKHHRLDNNIPVKIFRDDGDLVTETQNISRSGAYCRVNHYIAPMTKLKVCMLFSVPKNKRHVTRKISCEGIVVRSEPSGDSECYHVAIFFSDIAPKDAECITDYVNAYMNSDELV